MPDPVAVRLLWLWRRLEPWPGGKRAFAWMLARNVPYTGSIGALIETLAPGYARVSLRDRRAVRNHLDSVHAVAIANLGELATGLAVLTAVGDARGILVGLQMEYRKKARGTLLAECTCAPPVITEPVELKVVADVTDQAGDVVATATAVWRLARLT